MFDHPCSILHNLCSAAGGYDCMLGGDQYEQGIEQRNSSESLPDLESERRELMLKMINKSNLCLLSIILLIKYKGKYQTYRVLINFVSPLFQRLCFTVFITNWWQIFLYIGHFMNVNWFIYISALSIKEREAKKKGVLRKLKKNRLKK